MKKAEDYKKPKEDIISMSTTPNLPTSAAAAQVTIKQFLEAGVHFGHQTRRWNPKMAKYIFGERNDIYIIDLKKTMKMFRDASDFAKSIGLDGKEVLFVGTKKQAQETIKEEAIKAGMPYVNNRWLGGMLTNFATVNRSIKRLHMLEKMEQDGSLQLRSKKEQSRLMKEKDKLEKNLGGIKYMKTLPAALFVVDPHTENIAVKEANRLNIPVLAITDTNCDPDPVNWVIPANDDAIRSIGLITSKISESIIEGRMEFDKQLAEGIAAAATAEENQKVTEGEAETDLTKEEFEEKEFVTLDVVDEKEIEATESTDLLDIDDMLKETDSDTDIMDEFKK